MISLHFRYFSQSRHASSHTPENMLYIIILGYLATASKTTDSHPHTSPGAMTHICPRIAAVLRRFHTPLFHARGRRPLRAYRARASPQDTKHPKFRHARPTMTHAIPKHPPNNENALPNSQRPPRTRTAGTIRRYPHCGDTPQRPVPHQMHSPRSHAYFTLTQVRAIPIIRAVKREALSTSKEHTND